VNLFQGIIPFNTGHRLSPFFLQANHDLGVTTQADRTSIIVWFPLSRNVVSMLFFIHRIAIVVTRKLGARAG